MDGPYADEELIERLRQSDREAFRLLFERHQGVLFRRTLLLCRDADTAHEVVQETFVRIWERRRSLRPGRTFLAYAFRIAQNFLHDQARHRSMRQRVEPALPPPVRSEGDDPEEALRLGMLQEWLAGAIAELPARCREVFILSRFEGTSNADIARVLGLSVRTVENQIARALKILRTRLPR